MLSVFIDIEAELKEIEKEAGILRKKLEFYQKEADPDIRDSHLRAMATCMHGIYTGMENVFKILFNKFEGELPSGEDWHKKLLKRTRVEVPGIRPEIIRNDDLFAKLDELRSFRHIFRNKYQSLIIPERVVSLSDLAVQTVPEFRKAISDFQKTIEKSVKKVKRRKS